MKIAAQELLGIIDSGKRIAISGHVNPDGDAIGSCLAMALCLKKAGKDPIVLLEDYNEKFKIIPGEQHIYKDDYSKITADLFIALDCGDRSRLGKAEDVFARSPVTVNIDHHISNNGFADYNFVVPDASSTCEVVFDTINMYVPIDRDIASAIYAGIVLDTGGFRYSSTDSRTHIVVSKLLDMNIPFSELYSELMNTHSIPEVKSFSAALNNICFVSNCPVVYSGLSYQDISSLGVVAGKDFDGIVEYLLNIRGTEVALFAYEKIVGEVKVSMRSKNINVSDIARSFGGGGHMYAAGCIVEGSVEDAIRLVLEAVKNCFNANA